MARSKIDGMTRRVRKETRNGRRRDEAERQKNAKKNRWRQRKEEK